MTPVEGVALPPAVLQLAQAMAEGLARAGQHGAGDRVRSPDDRPPLVDLREAARLLGVSRMTVTRLCEQGRVPCVVVAQGARQKLRRVPRAFIEAAASQALAVGGELDLAGFAAGWLARRGGAGQDAPGTPRVLAVAGGGAG
jgi:excisionase family DNA binding protein